MDEIKYDFSEDVAIDQDALDIEWLRQPELFGKWGRKHAVAENKIDRLEHKLAVLEAELDKKVRTNPKKYGIISERATEGAIKSAIALTNEHKAITEEILTAKKNSAIVLSAVRALGHKRDALENLVRLMASEYFSGPIAPRDLSKEMTSRRVSDMAKDKMRTASAKRKE